MPSTECTFTIEILQGPQAFIRGDSNADPDIDIADVIFTLQFLFLGVGLGPVCPDGADANDDGAVDIADPIFTLQYLFTGGRAPPDPFRPICGLDPTLDSLSDCLEFPACQ